MPLTPAEKMRKYRQRLKEKDNYDDFKAKEKNRLKRFRLNNKRTSKIKERDRKRQGKRRQKLKETASFNVLYDDFCDELNSSFKHKSTLSRSVNRVKRVLPSSPRKRNEVIRTLSKELPTTELSLKHKSAISEELKTRIIQFYESDLVSRVAPGRKDNRVFKSADGSKERRQLRHMNMNIREARQLFLEDHENVGLSKFQSLRPKHVKLSNELPRNVCVCTYHEEIRLKLNALSSVWRECCKTTKELVDSIVCSRNENCMSRQCSFCPQLSFPEDHMKSEQMLKYEEWVSKDNRTEKVILSATFSQIASKIISKIPSFTWHCFIKDAQYNMFDSLKKSGEEVLQVDFAENYGCVQQNEVQSAHWNVKQITIFPAVFWHGDVVSSFGVISDEVSHEKQTVYSFLKHLLRKLVDSGQINVQKTLNVFSDAPHNSNVVLISTMWNICLNTSMFLLYGISSVRVMSKVP